MATTATASTWNLSTTRASPTTPSTAARYGLHFMFSHFNVFDSNRFSHNQAGVAVMFGHNVTMLNNVFADNLGASSYGLLIKELQYSLIRGNRFLDNTVGLLVDGGSDLNVHNNEVRGNGWGIRLISASTNDTIHHNNFVGNTFDMTTNVSYNRNLVDGNYWDKSVKSYSWTTPRARSSSSTSVSWRS